MEISQSPVRRPGLWRNLNGKHHIAFSASVRYLCMAFTPEEIEEFTTEAQELLDISEQELLGIDRGDLLSAHYDSLFRVFHSLKGAAGMMELNELQSHMHQLENLLVKIKPQSHLQKNQSEFFLRGVDAARKILAGRKVSFDYNLENQVPPPPAESKKEKPPAIQPSANSSPSKAKLKIMVIDDEAELTEVLSALLESAGFEVRKFTDAETSFSQITDFNPDVLLTDIAMPHMTGLDLLKKVRLTQPDLPVIFISGFATREILLEAIDFDVFGVIEKPFDNLRVIQLCRAAARRHQLNRLLNSSINLIMYQFADLDAFLASSGKDDVRRTIRNEVSKLIEKRNELRALPTKGS